MQKEVLIGDVKFWKEQDILYCKFYKQDENLDYIKNSLNDYVSILSFLSEGSYLPLIINLRELEGKFSFQVFNFLSKNSNIKEVVLSKAFLTNSKSKRILYSIFNFFNDPVIPNKIFSNPQVAVNFCNEKTYSFNAISK